MTRSGHFIVGHVNKLPVKFREFRPARTEVGAAEVINSSQLRGLSGVTQREKLLRVLHGIGVAYHDDLKGHIQFGAGGSRGDGFVLGPVALAALIQNPLPLI